MSDDELIALFDSTAQSTVVGLAFLLDELRRRESDRQTARTMEQTETMVRLTWAIFVLTLVVTVSTVVLLLR